MRSKNVWRRSLRQAIVSPVGDCSRSASATWLTRDSRENGLLRKKASFIRSPSALSGSR